MDFASALTIYGPLGIFAALMVVIIRQLLKREQDKADRQEEKYSNLELYYRSDVIPLMEKTTLVLGNVATALTQMEEKRKFDEDRRREEDLQRKIDEEAERKANDIIRKRNKEME